MTIKSYRDYTAEDIASATGECRTVANIGQYFVLMKNEVYAFDTKLDAIRALPDCVDLNANTAAAANAMEKQIAAAHTDKETGPVFTLPGVDAACEGYWNEFANAFREHSYDALEAYVERWSGEVAYGDEEDAETANSAMDDMEAHEEWLGQLPTEADFEAPETAEKLLDMYGMLSAW